MRCRSNLSLMSPAIGLVFSVVLFTAFAQTQSPRRKIKNFGSSLERIKWDEKKRAAVYTGKHGGQTSGQSEEDVVRIETTLVISDVLILDSRGLPVSGLNKDDFLVSEDGGKQEVEVFSVGTDAAIPRSLVLVIDSSFNQSGFLSTSLEAAKILVEGLGPHDRMAIVTDEVELLSDFTEDKRKLKKKLEFLEAHPISTGPIYSRSLDPYKQFKRGAHFSALLATLNEAFDDRDQRPIIIFQANGNEASMLQEPILPRLPLPPDDLPPDKLKEAMEIYKKMKRHEENISRRREFSLNDLYRAAEKSRATIYTVIPGYRLLGLSRQQQIERAKLWTIKYQKSWADVMPVRKWPKDIETVPDWTLGWSADCLIKEQTALAFLAGITGGWSSFLEEPTQAPEIYSRILSDMNRRYLVGYYPSNKEHDGQRRSVRIEVRGHPEYTVRGRNSYFAPGPE